MQSDDLDKRIKELAESNEPAFEEKAWDKMELLLDKHLPQEKKRRRIYFFLLFALLVSIPGYLILRNNFNAGTASEQEKSANQSAPLPGNGSENEKDASQQSLAERTPADQRATINTIPGTETNITPGTETSVEIPGKKALNTNGDHSTKDLFTENKKTPNDDNIPGRKKIIEKKYARPKKANLQNRGAGSIDELVVSVDTPKDNPAILPGSVTKDTTAAKGIATAKDTVTAKDTAATNETVKKPASKQQKKGGGFSINFSFGPDISSIGIHHPGKVNLQYGVGLGYAFSPRLTIRSGFYAVKKIYTAAPSDYHPPAGYWTYYTNLQQVNADCKVYEIPVSLLYNFDIQRDHNWFISAGSSSYIMKRETYGYEYKNASGQPVYMSRTINNKNRHILSVLDISGGYTYAINKRLSFMAEPYLKLPLTGVGFGKVKLNSTGILFTLGVKPFGK